MEKQNGKVVLQNNISLFFRIMFFFSHNVSFPSYTSRRVTIIRKLENKFSCFSSMFLLKKYNIVEQFCHCFPKKACFLEEELHDEILNKCESTRVLNGAI